MILRARPTRGGALKTEDASDVCLKWVIASVVASLELAATVAAYTPSLHEAPRVIGKRLAVIGRSLRK
jgi:hypothetical protein